MTAVAEDLDLSWVTFSGGDPGKPCDYGRPRNDPQCPLEPVARAEWEQDCCDVKAPELLCAGHADKLRAAGKVDRGRFRCSGCTGIVRLISIEPIR